MSHAANHRATPAVPPVSRSACRPATGREWPYIDALGSDRMTERATNPAGDGSVLRPSMRTIGRAASLPARELLQQRRLADATRAVGV